MGGGNGKAGRKEKTNERKNRRRKRKTDEERNKKTEKCFYASLWLEI